MKTTWRDSWKVARWEVKTNITNKSFLISIFITPIIFLLFAFVPGVLGSFGSSEPYTLYVVDELGVYDELSVAIGDQEDIVLKKWTETTETLASDIRDDDKKGYVVLDEAGLQSKNIIIFTGGDRSPDLDGVQAELSTVLQKKLLSDFGITEEQQTHVLKSFQFEQVELMAKETDFLLSLIPGIVAGIILFGVVTSGMMTFQSSMQEKKDKISEILLSSISAGSLMQGKIIGYFLLGVFQVAVWLAFGIPLVQIIFGIPVVSALMAGKFLFMLFYALAGYLLFSAIFVSMGATVEDINTSGNFQGIVFMLPFLPFFFIGGIISDPNGILAKVGSFFPLTTPGIMVLRLTVASHVPTLDIILSIVILLLGIWLLMKLAGKVFRVGMLLYGKNATPKEIWRWIRQ